MVSDYRCLWIPGIPEASQVHCRLLGDGKGWREDGVWIRIWASGILTHQVKHSEREHCITPVYCEAAVSLGLSWPIHARAWLFHNRSRKVIGCEQHRSIKQIQIFLHANRLNFIFLLQLRHAGIRSISTLDRRSLHWPCTLAECTHCQSSPVRRSSAGPSHIQMSSRLSRISYQKLQDCLGCRW